MHENHPSRFAVTSLSLLDFRGQSAQSGKQEFQTGPTARHPLPADQRQRTGLSETTRIE
jgi:hypothetical protein